MEGVEIAKIAHFIGKFGTFRPTDFLKSQQSQQKQQAKSRDEVRLIYNKLSQ